MGKHICYGGADIPGTLPNFGLLIVRVFLGFGMLVMGTMKIPPSPAFIGMVDGMGLPNPEIFSWIAALFETVGGALLILGLFTRWGALLILGVIITALVGVHTGDSFKVQFLPLLVAFNAFQFLLIGAGRFSLDHIMCRKADKGPMQ